MCPCLLLAESPDSLSRMTPTRGSLFLLRISQRAKGSSGVLGSSLNSRVMV